MAPLSDASLKLAIRPWTTDVPVPAITELLHTAYAPLAAMGLRFMATHQDDAMTLKRLRSGWSFQAYLGERLIGTITLRKSAPDSLCEWYRNPAVFSFGQFAVLPEFQGQGTGQALLRHVEQLAASEGAQELALDTAEGASHLIRWYQKRGYRQVDLVSWDDTNYRSVILSRELARAGRL